MERDGRKEVEAMKAIDVRGTAVALTQRDNIADWPKPRDGQMPSPAWKITATSTM